MSAPVPLPVDLSVAAAPLGWKGKLPDLFKLLEQSLVAQLSPQFLIGQTGGAKPTHDIGPWYDSNTGGWYWFDPLSGQYQPASQGAPVGTMAMWGGKWDGTLYIPPNWLQCYGQAVSRRSYSGLFTAIGETWGPGDGQTTFNLPPGGVFFISAAGFIADFRVPLSPIPQVADAPIIQGTAQTGPPQGVGAQGGGQLSPLLQPTDMPPMEVTVQVIGQAFNTVDSTHPGGDFPNPQPSGSSNLTSDLDEYLTDLSGNQLGKNQVGFSVMPPFVAINYMIKWQ